MTLKGGDKMDNKASLACQVRSNIRCVQEMKYPAMVTIFKNDDKRCSYINSCTFR